MNVPSKGTSGLAPVERETLYERVYHALRTAILEGEIADGERLVQEALATSLGVSRIPVRDALKRLEIDGLVAADERGAFYARSMTVEDAREIYSLRALLEPHAARQAIPRLKDEDLAQLRELHRGLRAAAKERRPDSYVSLNREFHLTLYRYSEQRRLIQFITSLWSGLPQMTPLVVHGQLDRSMREHTAIFEAIEQMDADHVAEVLREHIEHAGEALQRRLQGAES